MKDLVPEPERLRELSPAEDTLLEERRAAALLRGIAEPAALSPELLLRIKSRVLGGAPRRVGTVRIKVLLAAALLIASGGVVFAAQSLWQAAHRTQEIALPSGASAHVADARQRRMTLIGPARAELSGDEIALSSGVLALSAGAHATTIRSGEIALAVPAQGVVEVTASVEGVLLVHNVLGVVLVTQHGSETARLSPGQSFRAGHITPLATEQGRAIALLAKNGELPSNAPAERAPQLPPMLEAPAAPSPTPPSPAPPSDASPAPEAQKPSLRNVADPAAEMRESRLLSEALVDLRRDNDPRAALALLDQYSKHFPSGSLVPEAARARAEALIALGRRSEALGVLDDLSPAALGRSMLLVRAELRAELNRCSDALGDFSNALSQNPHDSVDERALFGRAMCRNRAADPSGARADLNSYALRFPRGRFHTLVEHALQK